MTGPELPLHAARFATPFGSLAVVVSPEDGVVRASGFRSLGSAVRTLPSPLAARGWIDAPLPAVAAAVAAWLAGDAAALDRVPAEQEGPPFMKEVWAAMRGVPAGEVATYGEIAAIAGRPRAARAAGTACARNALAPFVPCHRIVASNGVGAYGYGVRLKQEVLALEGARILPSR